jgi:hypothetical protein
MADFIGDAAGDIFGDIVGELVLKPVHWIVWATGVGVATLLSFGRFQIEPFSEDDEWLPEEAGPILHTFGATLIGSGMWIIAAAALVRELIL